MATSPGDGVSVRSVKLKVLYTFDAEQKDNHLARWPQSLDVQTAFVDETSQIGVIDLRTCLEAVTTASPELTTNLDTNDYTIYAYDYSEPDTPLAGQGMLSKTLANQEQNAGSDGEAMVTGRITKSVMGLFSRNAQETLEVKLRLTPVNTFTQGRYRSGSMSSQDGARPQWADNGSISQTFGRSGSPVPTAGLEAMQRMLNGETTQMPGPSSKPGTPNNSNPYIAQSREVDVQSRPSSRAGMHHTHARRDSMNSGYYSGDENMEEGPARKRAKTTKVDWPTKSNFNIERQPESLRVAASIASSVRLHRPVAINPATAALTVTPIEEGVRPPTPIPATKTGKPRGRPRRQPKKGTSNLVHGTQIRESSPAMGSMPQPELLDVPFTSPEETRARSVSSTPANFPSSPPVMPEHQHTAVTSPALPPMMGPSHDSGFMSGNLEDLFGDDQLCNLQFDDFILDKPEEQDVFAAQHDQPAAQIDPFSTVFDESNEDTQASIPSQPPMVPPPLPKSSRPMARAQSYNPATRVTMSSPRLAPAPIPRARQIIEEQRDQQRLKAIAPAPAPKSDPAPRLIHRAQTWAPDSDALMSDALAAEEARASKKKVGKEQTKARLEAAIAKGEMPPFCDNCGSIETPAWRRAYVKVFTCAWDDVETSLAQGECCYKEILTTNPDGTVKTFRGYKVEKKIGDDDWTSITLCNPCGLWFHKQKCPRPREKWQKKDPKDKGKRKKNGNSAKEDKKANGNPQFKSDTQTPASDDSSPSDSATEAPYLGENDNELVNNDSTMDYNEPQLPRMPYTFRASSADPGPRGLQTRNHHRPPMRQVQSSPGHPKGSEDAPVEIDLTPKPIRRQLFPSPDKPQVRSDPGVITTTSKHITHLPAFVRRSPRLNKTRDVFSMQVGAIAITADGKENLVPEPVVVDDGLADLFDEGPNDVELPPMTPTPKRRSERLLLKTPSKTPQRHFGADLSPNVDLQPSLRTPRSKNGQHPALAALLGTVHKDVVDMTPFTRSIHDAMTSDAPFQMLMLDGEKTAGRGSSKKSTPQKALTFDFPDLPSLKGSSPLSHDQLVNFNFSELTTDHLNSDFADPFATTTMPSSPPTDFFNFIDTNATSISDMWDEMIDADGGDSYPEPDASQLTTSAPALRRSPRRQRVR